MTASYVGTLLEHAVLTTFYMAAPMLLGGLVVGVLVSLFQALTQINEVTLVFIPKMLMVGLTMWLAGPWMYERLHLFFAEIVTALNMLSKNGF